MSLTIVHKFILFALGICSREISNRVARRQIYVPLSKAWFVDVIMKSEIVKKRERAVYKNLEALEKVKYISYKDKELRLTRKGEVVFRRVERELSQYFSLLDQLRERGVISGRKLQARFS